jgi:hypothetical protein
MGLPAANLHNDPMLPGDLVELYEGIFYYASAAKFIQVFHG